MGNQNSNPPHPSPQNIQVTSKTEGHTETVNAAGTVYGGVGNTHNSKVHAQGDKERVEKEIWELRSELTAMENEEKRRKDKVQKLELEIGKLKVEVEKFQQQTYGEREDAQSIKKKKFQLREEVQHHNEEITRLENGIQGLKEKILKAEIKLGVLKGTVEDTPTTLPALEKQVQEPQHALQEKTTQDKHGIEEGKKVAGDFKTGTYQQAGDEADQHGVTQKDSNPSHDADLLAACCDGNMADVKRVLDQGQVDINCRGELSSTPVMAAAVRGHREVVELLLNSGADVSPVDVFGQNILQLACNRGDVGTVKLILSQDGVDVNCRGRWRRTPVMEAAERGQRDLVELLLNRGADVSPVDVFGKNILQLACKRGDVGTVKMILSQDGVDVNCRGGAWRRTPAMVAAWWGRRLVVELLLRRGADVSLVDGLGNNILHYACMGRDVGMVELILFKDGVDVNARNNDGQTAADVARSGGHRQLADLLVSRAAR